MAKSTNTLTTYPPFRYFATHGFRPRLTRLFRSVCARFSRLDPASRWFRVVAGPHAYQGQRSACDDGRCHHRELSGPVAQLGPVGVWGGPLLVRRILRIDPAKEEAAVRFYRRYGVWSLLLSWLPIIGDPLCLASGILKIDFTRFSLLVFTGKLAPLCSGDLVDAGRYAYIINGERSRIWTEFSRFQILIRTLADRSDLMITM